MPSARPAIRPWIVLVLVANVVAFGLILFETRREVAAREAKAKAEARRRYIAVRSEENRRDVFGDLGTAILWDPSRIEVLEVDPEGRLKGRHMDGKVWLDVLRAKGVDLGRKFAGELAGFFLGDFQWYAFDDLPEPEDGYRIWRGHETMDLLYSIQPPGSSHVDVWVYVKDSHGDVVTDKSGPWCITDRELAHFLSRPAMPAE